ncbi:MAG: AroM family protein [Lachnospiraceae bacterium]
MEKIKIGAITVGQAPRVDVVPEMQELLPPHIEIVEAGALDGMTREEIESMPSSKEDYILVSRLMDGSSVRMAEAQIIPKLQEKIKMLEDMGAVYNLLLCTGEFLHQFETRVPLLFPERILIANVKPLLYRGRLGVITPLKEQQAQSRKKWSGIAQDITMVSASPYGDIKTLKAAAMELKEKEAALDLIVLDCIGYDTEMKRAVREITGAPVMIARSMIARVIAEILS